MDFNEFKKRFTDDFQKRLEERGIYAECADRHVEKFNTSYDALSVIPMGSCVGVNVNLDAIFRSYVDGVDYSDVVDCAVSDTEAQIQDAPDIDVAKITDYAVMKRKLVMEVVSADKNVKILQNIPYEQMEDIAVVYRLILGQDSDSRTSILVTTALMEQFGISYEQLRSDAMTSAPVLRPFEIKGISEVMAEMMGAEKSPVIDSTDDPIFVASVSDKTYGAGVIAYPNFFECAAEKLNGDFYVLPSSIHEVLLLRDSGHMSAKDLEAMVREINAAQVAPEERLTDHVYHYDSKEHVFELAEKFEQRHGKRDAVENEIAKGSLLCELKAKKETAIKDTSGKHAKDVMKLLRGGEAL